MNVDFTHNKFKCHPEYVRLVQRKTPNSLQPRLPGCIMCSGAPLRPHCAARLVAQRYCTVWYTDTLDQYCHPSLWASNIEWPSVQPKLIIIKFNRFLYDNCDLISQQWDHGSDWCGSLTQPSMQQTSYYLYLVSRARQSYIILTLILLPFPPTCFRADN